MSEEDLVRSAEPPMHSFSHDLDAIDQHDFGARVAVGDLETLLQGRGFASICLILCVPFIQPVPIPGLSIAFGVAIMALGLRLALGSAGGLPGFIKRQNVSSETLKKIVGVARKLFDYVEKVFRPRYAVMFRPPLLNLIGISIMAGGLALSMPLPPVILFSNSLPAWSIIALCLGYLQRDGLVTAIGHFLALASWVYFAFWWEAAKAGVMALLPVLMPIAP